MIHNDQVNFFLTGYLINLAKKFNHQLFPNYEHGKETIARTNKALVKKEV